MVTVVVTLPDILPCVLRAGMGPLGKGSSLPALWRNIQRYWILRRICPSINCSAADKCTSTASRLLLPCAYRYRQHRKGKKEETTEGREELQRSKINARP